MKYFDWNNEKNILLKMERDVCFEDVIVAISCGNLLDIVEHPKRDIYSHQRMFIVRIDNYAYLVPFVEDERKIFLKTIIPSRKATQKYLLNS